MAEMIQFAKPDGHPDWTVGNSSFDFVWENVRDRLRFHIGKGWRITQRPDGQPGPTRELPEVHDLLPMRLEGAPPDTVFQVESEADGFALLFRRHEVASPPGELLLEEANRLIGTAYVRGGTDCSWYSMHCVEEVSEIRLPHRAGCAPSLGPSQLHDPSVLHISRAQLKAGDLLFHHGDATAVDHVSIYLDNKGPGGNGRVMDEEPHDTGAPAGWPTSTLGVGAQIRPMNPGYYCDWEHVVAIGRVVEINGKP